MFRYVVILLIKVTSRGHLEVKLVTVTEYTVEKGIEKNDWNKSYRSQKDYFLVTWTLNLTLRLIWIQIQLRHDWLQTWLDKARSVSDPVKANLICHQNNLYQMFKLLPLNCLAIC